MNVDAALIPPTIADPTAFVTCEASVTGRTDVVGPSTVKVGSLPAAASAGVAADALAVVVPNNHSSSTRGAPL